MKLNINRNRITADLFSVSPVCVFFSHEECKHAAVVTADGEPVVQLDICNISKPGATRHERKTA